MMFIEVRPGDRPGTYVACLRDRVLCVSRQPFLDASRALLAEGISPETVIVMRWSTTGTESLRSTVGHAAGLTVEDGRDGVPRFRSWRAYSTGRASPVRSLEQGRYLVTGISSYAPG